MLTTLVATAWWSLVARSVRTRGDRVAGALAWIAGIFAVWATLSLIPPLVAAAGVRSVVAVAHVFLALVAPVAWWIVALRIAAPPWLRTWHLVAFAIPSVALATWAASVVEPFAGADAPIGARVDLADPMGIAALAAALAYGYVLVATAAVVVLRTGARPGHLGRGAASWLVAATVPPVAAASLWLAGTNPFPAGGLDVVALGASALMLLLAVADGGALDRRAVALGAAFDAIAEPALVVQSDGTVLEANREARSLLYDGRPMQGQALLAVAPQLESARRGGGGRGDDRHRLTGELEGFAVRVAHQRDPRQAIRTTVITLRDERDTLRREQRLRDAAHRDALTGITNRLGFEAALRTELATLGPHALGIVFIDLDGFKPINDTHGHAVGDVVLVEVATRLADLVRAADFAARLGGDEFGLLLRRVRPEDLGTIAERVEHALERPIHHGDLRLSIGASLGLASAPRDGTALEALVRRADERMYRQKQARGRGRDRDATLRTQID